MSYPLKIQLALRSGITIEQLVEKYKLVAKRHSNYNNLILFKYNQIESNFNEKITRESRGLILDENSNWKIINHAFDKFFNHGEGLAARIDWNTAKVQAKVDGSLLCLWYYDGAWQVSTSGGADASGNVDKSDLKFREYFWRTFHNMNGTLPINTNLCYFFELTGPLNKVVVVHSKESLTLLGARDLSTGQEISVYDLQDTLNIPVVQHYPLSSFEEIQKAMENMSGTVSEGFIVVDGDFNRVKLKCKSYLLLHHMKDSFSQRAMVDIARMGELDEIVANFPEYGKILYTLDGQLKQIATQIQFDYERIKMAKSQKEFALLATETRFQNAMFMLRSSKIKSAKDYLAKIKIDSLMDILNIDTSSEL